MSEHAKDCAVYDGFARCTCGVDKPTTDPALALRDTASAKIESIRNDLTNAEQRALEADARVAVLVEALGAAARDFSYHADRWRYHRHHELSDVADKHERKCAQALASSSRVAAKEDGQ